jgi:hypothetical protein
MTVSPTYRMKLDLNVLNHLGFNLYSNVAAVLSEAVANAWDADSPMVSITIDTTGGLIEITDTGSGMTVVDANQRFLNVGYNKRRSEGTQSPGGRVLMGRKGIGKLSLFSVAGSVTVTSMKDGGLHGFKLSVPAIEEAIANNQEYYPESVLPGDLPALSCGTMIRLSDLRKRATAHTVSALRKRIARRFSVFGPEFQVKVNGVAVSVADRDDLSKAQFLWEFGTAAALPASETSHVARRATLDSVVHVDGRDHSVRGWIGSARLPRDLVTIDSGNLNSIVVLARGRLIQENILDRVNIGGLFTKYLTGQIEADFLDLDEEDDIATSDRQRVVEDDPRYQALLAFVLTALNKIEANWSEWRADLGTKEAVTTYPHIGPWIESLPAASRASARRVIGSIQGLALNDESRRKELLRHGLIAFERLRLSESTERLANSLETNANELLPLLGEQDQLEAALYLDIIRSRLAVIRRFESLVDADAKEKVLQEYIFTHLWLIDPSWARATGSERMEERVHKAFEGIDADLTEEERKGRIDIRYRTMAGRHVIIELKRYSVTPSVWDLGKQGAKYVGATQKLLNEARRGHEPVEIVFVLGGSPKEPDTQPLANLPGRTVTYEQLIQGAIQNYSEYVEQRKKVDAIESLLAS